TRIVAGPWTHGAAPTTVPAWAIERRQFVGILTTAVPGADGEVQLVARAIAPAPDARRFVIVDLPLDRAMADGITTRTGTALGGIATLTCGPNAPPTAAAAAGAVASEPREESTASAGWSIFRGTVSTFDCVRWSDGTTGDVTASVEAPVSRLVDRLASVRSVHLEATVGNSWWTIFVLVL